MEFEKSGFVCDGCFQVNKKHPLLESIRLAYLGKIPCGSSKVSLLFDITELLDRSCKLLYRGGYFAKHMKHLLLHGVPAASSWELFGHRRRSIGRLAVAG